VFAWQSAQQEDSCGDAERVKAQKKRKKRPVKAEHHPGRESLSF